MSNFTNEFLSLATNHAPLHNETDSYYSSGLGTAGIVTCSAVGAVCFVFFCIIPWYFGCQKRKNNASAAVVIVPRNRVPSDASSEAALDRVLV